MAILMTGSEAKKLEVTPTFEECSALMDCEMIETITLNGGMMMLVDEDGLGKRSAFNEIASEIATSGSGMTYFIVGKAILLTSAEVDTVLN
jgi:Zn-finger domain-containing protein